ncbi:MAG: tetratricopeptide repeat protein [Polyangiales bacterium]
MRIIHAATLSTLLAACATTSRAPVMAPAVRPERAAIQGDGFRVIGTTATREGDAYDAALLFDRAVAAMQAQRCDDALRDLDTLLREFGATRYAYAAHFNRGLCHQRAQRWGEAETEFRAAAEDPADRTVVRDALFRLAVVGERAALPTLVLDATDRLLALPRREIPDAVEAHARRGAALLALGRLDEAVAAAQRAVELAPTREAISALGDDSYAAMARVIIGDVTRARAAAVQIRVDDSEASTEAIRERTRLVMRAHALFNDALHVGNPEWQAAAGFRIGEMYRELYRAIVDAPLPEAWERPAREIYRRRAAEQLRTLLSSALTIWELTRAMARREVIQSNEWARRTDEAIEELRAFIAGAPQPGPTTPRRPAAPTATPRTVRPAG